MKQALNDFMSRLPEADRSWHCKWFWTIIILTLNGAVFGLVAYFTYDIELGRIAAGIGLICAAYVLGMRQRDGKTC